jgi:hypothetical protein
MPIRRDLRCLYPPHWPELSWRIRFERAGGRCQACGRPHLVQLRCLPDGRWFDEAARTWRNRRGKPCRWPDLIEAAGLRSTRVVLAAAHLDGNSANNRPRNLRSVCQRCHVLHDENEAYSLCPQASAAAERRSKRRHHNSEAPEGQLSHAVRRKEIERS